MNQKWLATGMLVMLLSCVFLGKSPEIAEAALVRGSAAIVNGDMAKARREAREDAMRSCIEQEVGTHTCGKRKRHVGVKTHQDCDDTGNKSYGNNNCFLGDDKTGSVSN